MSILRLAGKASIRRRPVNSALGRRIELVVSATAASTPLPVWLRLGGHRTRISGELPFPHATHGAKGAVFSAQAVTTTEPSRSGGSLEAAARSSATSRRSVCRSRRVQPSRRLASAQTCAAIGQRLVSSTVGPAASFREFLRRPNWSFNRSANGMAPGPRSARCLSSAARARHHAVVARLTLR